MLDGSVLIVDDNKSVLQSLKLYLKRKFKEVYTLNRPDMILQELQSNSVDVVLLDMNFKTGINTGNEGLYWIQRIHEFDKNIPVIPITAYGHVDLAVKSIKEGAFDFVLKPWENEKLYATLQAAYQYRKTRLGAQKLKDKQKQLIQTSNKLDFDFISKSKAMQAVLNAIDKVSATDANVLIQGENGTGKELVARMIHKKSLRKDEVFMSVDLGAIPETLFESELFGYMKGAFSDAKENRAGKFEVASGGTLFLDEVSNLSYPSQAKLLTVLQNRELYRLGSSNPTPIDIRLISATNKDLENQVNENLFREDLLFRINTILIEIPPLRKRTDDIPLLINHYLKYFADRYSKVGLQISLDAIDKLCEYHWPGNVRELVHTIEKAVIMTDSATIQADEFYFGKAKKTLFDVDKSLSLEDGEKILIERSLAKNRGNISESARELGVGRQTLYRKIQKYGLSDYYDS